MVFLLDGHLGTRMDYWKVAAKKQEKVLTTALD